MQDEITPEEIAYADALYTDFSNEFELIYIQRKSDCLHMARQSIHSRSHNTAETTCLGPLMNTSQWTIEHAIGLLVGDIQSDVQPFSNICHIAHCYCQINALLSVLPDLNLSTNEHKGPPLKLDAGSGYFIVQPQDRMTCPMSAAEAASIK
jgi:hypothetical protein